MTATLDHHYSITLSLLRIVLLLWGEEQMISIPAVNDNLLILHGMDFIYWRVIFFFDRNRSTLDHHFSLSLPLDHHYSLSILRITLLSCCDGRMILIPAVNDNLLILHGTDVFYGCFIIYIPVNATFQHTVRSPWCFEQRVITPANNNHLIARNVRLSWDYEQMLSQPAVIDNLFIIAFHGVYFFLFWWLQHTIRGVMLKYYLFDKPYIPILHYSHTKNNQHHA